MWWGTARESADPGGIARFYSALVGWPIVNDEPDLAVLAASPQGPYFVFDRVEDYRAPTWPPAEGDQRPMMHYDFQVGDLDSAMEDAVALGATVADHQPQEAVRVMLDPEGHPFCLCRDDG